VFFGGRLIGRERYRLSPENGSLTPLRTRFATAYYGSCFVISPRLASDAPCWPAVHALHEDAAWVGCSPLRSGGWAIKLIAADSVTFRRKLDAIRRELYAALGRPEPALRRGPR
jgi:urease accessory protein